MCIRDRAKVNNEDYRTEADKRRAFEDFKDRIRKYEEVYEPMQEEHLSFIKLINQGRRVEINNIHGFLLGRIVQFLSNLHAKHQTIYLSRHGQSEYNFQGKSAATPCCRGWERSTPHDWRNTARGRCASNPTPKNPDRVDFGRARCSERS